MTANATSGFDYAVYECRDSVNLASSVTSNYADTGIRGTGIASGWNYVKAFVKSKLGVLFPKLFGASSTTFFKSAFCGAPSAGVRCPWRFANLNNGGNAGLACENGNNTPGNANWNSRPRLYSSRRQTKASAEKRLYIPAQAKICKTGNPKGCAQPWAASGERYKNDEPRCAASSNKADPALRFSRNRTPLHKNKDHYAHETL